jgi:putative ABC transport system substrate-binding protein
MPLSLSLGEAMRRREFITFLGGAAAVWPLAAHAQPSSMPMIGYIRNGTLNPSNEPFTIAFRQGLAEMGFTEGRNVAIEYRSTEGHLERLPKLTVDLVRRQVAVMFVAGGDMPALVAKGATRSIPIVFTTSADPAGLASWTASIGRGPMSPA